MAKVVMLACLQLAGVMCETMGIDAVGELREKCLQADDMGTCITGIAAGGIGVYGKVLQLTNGEAWQNVLKGKKTLADRETDRRYRNETYKDKLKIKQKAEHEYEEVQTARGGKDAKSAGWSDEVEEANKEIPEIQTKISNHKVTINAQEEILNKQPPQSCWPSWPICRDVSTKEEQKARQEAQQLKESEQKALVEAEAKLKTKQEIVTSVPEAAAKLKKAETLCNEAEKTYKLADVAYKLADSDVVIAQDALEVFQGYYAGVPAPLCQALSGGYCMAALGALDFAFTAGKELWSMYEGVDAVHAKLNIVEVDMECVEYGFKEIVAMSSQLPPYVTNDTMARIMVTMNEQHRRLQSESTNISIAVHDILKADAAYDNNLWCHHVGWGCGYRVPQTVINALSRVQQAVQAWNGALDDLHVCLKLQYVHNVPCDAATVAAVNSERQVAMHSMCENFHEAARHVRGYHGKLPTWCHHPSGLIILAIVTFAIFGLAPTACLRLQTMEAHGRFTVMVEPLTPKSEPLLSSDGCV